MDDDRVLKTLRYMAWKRAEGELEGLLQTYWGEGEDFDAVDELIEKFKKDLYELLG